MYSKEKVCVFTVQKAYYSTAVRSITVFIFGDYVLDSTFDDLDV